MGELLSEYTKAITQFYEDVENFTNELNDVTSKIVNAEMNKADKEFGKYQRVRIEAIFQDAVDNFYKDYEPKIYNRRGSLYNLLDVEMDTKELVDYDTVDDLIDPSKMAGNRSGADSEGMYDLVFVRGFHGGASSIASSKVKKYGKHPHAGTPYYRTPPRKWTRWGNKAEQAKKSAYIMFGEQLSKEESSSIAGEYDRITDNHVQIAQQKITEKIHELMKKYSLSPG